MIVEMRIYQTKPGMPEEFLRIFRSKSVPAHLEIGMRILGPFLSVDDPDTFFFMRGFPDLPSERADEGEILRRRAVFEPVSTSAIQLLPATVNKPNKH